MGVALFDLSMPSWPGAENDSSQSVNDVRQSDQEVVSSASQEIMTPPVGEKTVPGQKAEGEIPQGSAAAELAAAAKPRRASGDANASLPAPLLTAGPQSSPFAAGFSGFAAPLLPEPSSPGLPLARAGISLPSASEKAQASREENFWDVLSLKSLPIPGLGSAQAAHAAALDMPVPSVTNSASPFMPAEQAVGGGVSGGRSTSLPGAPPLPNAPHGQGADGAPLPPRQYVPGGGIPEQSLVTAPAPNIAPQAPMDDPNLKAQELARQQQDILMLRQQMDQRLKDLQSAEDKMKGVLKEAKDIEDKKVRTLIQMYANMKPRMAAQALEKMDERIAVRILSGMAPKQSGEILTYTNPSKTAKLTEMITRLRLLN